MTEPTLAKHLFKRKVEMLERAGPEIIATARHRLTVAPWAAGEPPLHPLSELLGPAPPNPAP